MSDLYGSSRFRIVLVVMLAWMPALVGARPGGDRDGAWLLGQLATTARGEARTAARAGHQADARTWQAWAGIYDRLAANPQIAHTPARVVLGALVQANRASAAEARRYGARDAEALFAASATFWAGLDGQLERGQPLVIALPRELLHAVPGLPDSPWASLPAATPVQQLVLCDGLATRARQCQAQLAQLQHDQAIGVTRDADPIVVQRTICDRAQEAYVARCMK